MSNPYKTREGGATVTVFVPYDCNNHCPFCINKKEYADCTGFSLDAILDSIRTMDAITPRCDFVFTGGEPLANLEALQKMLDAIPTTHKVYINTTFPVQEHTTLDEMVAFTERNKDKITCMNISRHLVKYVEESPDQVLGQIACPTRINCVLYKNYPADKLNETIIDFHNTPVRYEQFKEALKNNKSGRAATAEDEIKFVLDRESDAGIVVDALKDGRIPLRVTHNDTKLNNVLLDNKTGEGVCVIDLDTVMPGSLLYDYGDALRFGGSSGAEDERDLDKIYFKVENFTAFTRGFLEELTSITDAELELLPFSIKLMTLECGSRFLADYLNGDTYFKTAYPEHNLVRARTQFKLVRDIEDKYDELCRIVHEIAGR